MLRLTHNFGVLFFFVSYFFVSFISVACVSFSFFFFVRIDFQKKKGDEELVYFACASRKCSK